MPATQELIDQIMHDKINLFANAFKKDYAPRGAKLRNLINKANNPFILALGEEIVIYSTLMRSLDSSLGNCLEEIARAIAGASYYVYKEVEGDVPKAVDQQISDLMSAYTSKKRKPQSKDIEEINATGEKEHKVHKSDYHLVKKSDNRQHFLLELKIGGDLDNKKARSEKQALLEQYAILKYSPRVKQDSIIRLYFATAYNMFGEEAIWNQERVRQFFSADELLIGNAFWNFVCDSNEGYKMVIDAYKRYAPLLKAALESIIAAARKSSNIQQTSFM